jgi:hypothetical protein
MTEEWGFDSREGQEILLSFITSRPALWPTQPPIQRIPGYIFMKAKQPEHEADHSSAEQVDNFSFVPFIFRYHTEYPGGGHSIGHSKQETVYVHVSYSERFPR